MPEALASSVFFGSFITLFFYEVGLVIRKKTGKGWVNPLLIAIVLTIAFLLLFKVDYATYKNGSKYISFLLTPATVSLAIPLYEQFELLKKHKGAILAGILAGVLTSLVLILLLSILFGLSHREYVTLLPKSVTTAIGLGLSERMGGIPSVTALAIIVTGVMGNALGEPILKLFHVTDPIAKGIGLGSASHAIGTAKAMEIGEVEGAMSGLSIVVAGVLTVLFSLVFTLIY